MKSNLAKNLSEIKIIVPNETVKMELIKESKNLYSKGDFKSYETLAHLHLLPNECWLNSKEIDNILNG